MLGPTGSRRIDTLVHDIVATSEGVDDIRQSPEVGEAMLSLRAFMFERVYLGPQVEPEHRKAHETVRAIFDHLVAAGDDADEIVDYIAGMTDRFALELRGLALSLCERALDLRDIGRSVDRAVEGERPLELDLGVCGPTRDQHAQTGVPAEVRLDHRVPRRRHDVRGDASSSPARTCSMSASPDRE